MTIIPQHQSADSGPVGVPTLSPEQLEAELLRIRARRAAAVPGPWHIMLGSGNNLCTAIGSYHLENGRTALVADCQPDYSLGDDWAEFDHRPTMEFLRKAPEDIDRLLATVEQLRSDLDRLKGIIARLRTAAVRGAR